MYPRHPDDPPAVGDGAGARRYVVPPGTRAVAVRAGVVRRQQYGATATGQRLWIHHEDGYRTGYFHLAELLVQPGERVREGQPIGVVGHNPQATDPLHLHLEVSPIEAYRPEDPTRYLAGAKHLTVAAVALLVLLWGAVRVFRGGGMA